MDSYCDRRNNITMESIDNSCCTAAVSTAPPPLSLFKRPLPNTVVGFSTVLGKQYFKSALNAGYAEIYFPLSSAFTTQSEAAFCGLGTLTMVLNALQIDPKRNFTGPWRWWKDEHLDCCRPLDYIRLNGITLREFGCLATCNGVECEITFADEQEQSQRSISIERFESDIKACVSSESRVLVVSYSRTVLQQTGEGHFSPVAAFDPQSRMVLIMDVARFKYPAYWCHVDLLWESLKPIDKQTNRSRGYAVLFETSDCHADSLLMLLTIGIHKGLWVVIQRNMERIMLQCGFKCSSQPSRSRMASYLRLVYQSIPGESICELVIPRRRLQSSSSSSRTAGVAITTDDDNNTDSLVNRLHQVYSQLHATRFYGFIQEHVMPPQPLPLDVSCTAEDRIESSNRLKAASTSFALFLLASWHLLPSRLPQDDSVANELIEEVTSSCAELANEIGHLKRQIDSLCQCCES